MATARPRGQLREDILDAADRLLFNLGDAHEVSIDAVVAGVGCTPPALYYYFPSKEDLLLEVCRRRYQSFARELEAAIPPTDDPLEELIARGHAYLDWAVAHPEHYRLLFMTTTGSPPEAHQDDARQAAGLAELVDNIERAVAAGEMAPGEPLQMALMLWSTVHGISSLAVANPTLPSDYAHLVVEFTGRAVLQALAPGSEPSRVDPSAGANDSEV